jgi:hypothetical protein
VTNASSSRAPEAGLDSRRGQPNSASPQVDLKGCDNKGLIAKVPPVGSTADASSSHHAAEAGQVCQLRLLRICHVLGRMCQIKQVVLGQVRHQLWDQLLKLLHRLESRGIHKDCTRLHYPWAHRSVHRARQPINDPCHRRRLAGRQMHHLILHGVNHRIIITQKRANRRGKLWWFLCGSAAPLALAGLYASLSTSFSTPEAGAGISYIDPSSGAGANAPAILQCVIQITPAQSALLADSIAAAVSAVSSPITT